MSVHSLWLPRRSYRISCSVALDASFSCNSTQTILGRRHFGIRCISPLASRLYFIPGLQTAFYPWPPDCILPLVSRLYFTPGLQTVFYPWSPDCILSLVSRLYFIPGLQTVFYPWSTVCIAPLIFRLYFTPGLESAFHTWSPDCILPLVYSLHFTPDLQTLFYPQPPQRGGSAESFASALSNSQHTHAILATRTAIHASVFTVIVADAPA